ncbi:oligoribonuclease [Demequina sp. NBRC 110054]|uniref:oligoribonuclease n=1 Tax=Demequina sp. NBRC 110054 TaxID=1570343 RepID=UPI0009FFC48F|nr:oligoribonuclease [Demequina sp. NBRC 110054]
MASDHLVWIDCEMTGLDLENDALVEVACLVTDAELNVLGEGVSVVIRPPAAALEQMNDFVTKMHETSGLLPELEHGTTMQDAQQQVLAYINAHIPAGARPPLAGNTVGMDKAFLERDMPQLMERLHYRVVDVSSLKELVRRWYPRVFFHAPDKTGNHRALGDIQDSIAELRYYRETILVPLPGPDSDESRAASERVVHPSTEGAAAPTPEASEATG